VPCPTSRKENFFAGGKGVLQRGGKEGPLLEGKKKKGETLPPPRKKRPAPEGGRDQERCGKGSSTGARRSKGKKGRRIGQRSSAGGEKTLKKKKTGHLPFSKRGTPNKGRKPRKERKKKKGGGGSGSEKKKARAGRVSSKGGKKKNPGEKVRERKGNL